MKKKLLSVVTMFAMLLTTVNIPVGAVTTPATNTEPTASVHTEEEPDVVLESSISLEETVGGYTITVSGNIPEDVYLEVIHLTDTGTYEEMINDTGSYITRQVYEAFDITLWQDDLEWQPVDYDTMVTVSIKGTEVEAEDVMVHRIDEEAKTVDALECEVLNDGSVEFETEHFTIYTIDGNGYDLPETCSVEAGVLDLSKVASASELNQTVIQLIEENASLDAVILPETICFTEEVTLPGTFTVYGTNNAETTYTTIPTTLKGVTLINTGNIDELTDIGEKTAWNISTTEEPLNVFLFKDGTLLFDGDGKSISWEYSATYSGYSYTDSSPKVYYSYSIVSYSGTTYAYANWKTKKIIPWSYGGIREKISYAIVHSGDYTANYAQCSLFRKCTNLTDVTIHCDMPSATAYMFSYCSSLENITFNGNFANAVTTKSCEYTFDNCSKLKEIYLPNGAYQSVTSGAMNSFFDGCSSLMNVTLPDGFASSVTNGNMDSFFKGCSSLTSVTLPDGFASNVTSGSMNSFFSGCSNLTNITLPDGFGSQCTGSMEFFFSGCSGLTNLTLPDGFASNVKSGWMQYFFSGCSSLTSVTLPDGFGSQCTGNMASFFKGCSSLTSVTLPDGFGSQCEVYMELFFRDCSSLTNITLPDGFGSRCTGDMHQFFYGCSSLTNITLPDGFGSQCVCNRTNAMEEFFSGCSSLTSVTLPDGFGSQCTGNMASFFKGCSSLTNVTLPDGFGSQCVGSDYGGMESFFYNCRSLTNVTLPDGFGSQCTKAMASFFYGCSSLTNVTLPDGFGNQSKNFASFFKNCRSLTSITLPNGFGNQNAAMTSFFENCNSLTSVTLPDGFASNVTSGSLGSFFKGCNSLTSVTLPDGFASNVKSGNLGSFFSGCSSLTSITLPNGFASNVTTGAMNSFFEGCSKLTSVTLPDGFGSQCTGNLYSFFSGCKSLTSVTLPDGFGSQCVGSKYAGMNHFFYDCRSLTSVSLPDGFGSQCTGRMDYFFHTCSKLTNVILPDGFGSQCTAEMNYFFYDCRSLTSVSLPDGFAQNASNITQMFYNTGLLNLDLPVNFGAKATTYTNLLSGSTSLHTITMGQNETVRNYTLPTGTYYIYDDINKAITDTKASYLTPKTDGRVVVTKAYNLHSFEKDHSEGDYDYFICSDCGLEIKKELASSYTIKFPTSIELAKNGETYTGEVYVKATGRISSEDSGLYITFPGSFTMTAGDVSETATITPPDKTYFDTLSSTESIMTATIEAPLSQAGEYTGSFMLSWEVK